MRSIPFFARSLGIFGVAVLSFAASATYPGTLNYVEGSVTVDGKEITAPAIGSTSLQPGSVLQTEAGRAEVLLTPGVFLRIGNNSEVRMVSAGLTDTRLALSRGVAMLEANDVHKENKIQIASTGLNTLVKKHGLYRFDADAASVAVFDGKAEVREDDEIVEVKKGRQATAGTDELKAEKFDRDEAKKTDELYQWSSLRSKYLSEASAVTAQRVLLQPNSWYGSGWYWNPGFRTYSWLTAGNSFFGPFGYGFYNPWRSFAPVYVYPRYRSPRMGSYPGRGMRRPPQSAPSVNRSPAVGTRGRGR